MQRRWDNLDPWTKTKIIFASMVLFLVVDVVTAGLAYVVSNQQDDTIAALHAGVCRNGEILADGLQQQISQQQNISVYRQFFPQIPAAQLRTQISVQIEQERSQIAALNQGC